MTLRDFKKNLVEEKSFWAKKKAESLQQVIFFCFLPLEPTS
jgi:hypothetical protein